MKHAFIFRKKYLEVEVSFEEFENLYLLYDPIHLLKNVSNN